MGLCRACLFDYATRPVEPASPVAGSGFGESGRSFADYTLGRQLGRGGMGVVYEAVQTSLRRPVALKMILDAEASSPTARRRFTLEAETAAKLDHPNIVPIYEIGEHQGQPFLSMKLIVGEDLRRKIASGDLCLTPRGNGTSRTDLRERGRELVADLVPRLAHRFGVGLGEDRAEHRGDHVGVALGDVRQEIAGEVDPTPLVGRALEGPLQRLHETGVLIADDQLHPGKAALFEAEIGRAHV